MTITPVWRHRILAVVILAAGIGGFILLKITRPTPHPVVAHERIWRVTVTVPTPATQHPVLTLFGRIEAPDRLRAAAPVAGRVLEMRVRDGERVAATAVLVRLDPRDLEPRQQRAQAELDRELSNHTYDVQALAQERELLRLAELAVTRAQTVQGKNLGSVSSVDEARRQLAQARLAVTVREQSVAAHPARLAALRATVAEAQRDVARGTIRAPFAAQIGTVDVAAGDQVNAQQTLVTLYPINGLYLRAKIPGCHCTELRHALAAGVQLPARGQQGGQPINAVLERIAGEGDARGVDALLKLAADTALPLGTLVAVQLERPAVANAIAVPFSALHGGNRIYAVRDGRLVAITVERIGETASTATVPAQALIRAADLPANTPVMLTHLPNAIAGLRVEIIP